MKVGILTGGGDCPGLNSVIRAAVRTVCNTGGQVLGLLEGWRGAIEGNFVDLNPGNTDDIISRGGTILGLSADDHDRLSVKSNDFQSGGVTGRNVDDIVLLDNTVAGDAVISDSASGQVCDNRIRAVNNATGNFSIGNATGTWKAADNRVDATFLLYPPLQWATVTEFHPVTLAAPLLMFCIWAAEERRYGVLSACAVLAALTKPEVRARIMAASRARGSNGGEHDNRYEQLSQQRVYPMSKRCGERRFRCNGPNLPPAQGRAPKFGVTLQCGRTGVNPA